MLLNLSIRNLAIFEDVSIDFQKGFNVITGETGAGKSILIESLFLLMGSRAGKNLVRKDSQNARVSAVFDISGNEKVAKFLVQNNIKIEEEDCLIIIREITETGKSINKINNNVVSISILKELGAFILDIFGQFEHQYIYKKENHLTLLDNLNGAEADNTLFEYKAIYSEYKDKCKEVSELEEKLVNKDRKAEQYRFELDEICNANLTENEEEDLINELKILSNVKEIKASLFEVINNINKDEKSAVNMLNNSFSLLSKLRNLDENLESFTNRTDLLVDELQNLVFEIMNYAEKLEVNEESLFIAEDRLSVINRLKRKYGFSIDKIEEYRSTIEKEYNVLIDAEENLNILNSDIDKLKMKLFEKSEVLTNLRYKSANFLENNIVSELEDLNMKDVKFKVNISKKDDFSPNGLDNIEFLMSTNLGQELSPIHKIVSGGEASRIMLALKKLSNQDEYSQTLVFDEIDTGISGKTSQMAGSKMKYISQKNQVICVTHSPQIASISKNHFCIEKESDGSKTNSIVSRLRKDERIKEVARLLSGMNITEKSLNNAKELIDFDI